MLKVSTSDSFPCGNRIYTILTCCFLKITSILENFIDLNICALNCNSLRPRLSRCYDWSAVRSCSEPIASFLLNSFERIYHRIATHSRSINGILLFFFSNSFSFRGSNILKLWWVCFDLRPKVCQVPNPNFDLMI